jgi:anthranilate synthase/phosphoribosyltransferase
MNKYQNIVMIDNYDSFTYILVDYFERLGSNVKVFRNDISIEELKKQEFDLMVLSPGPSVPKNAGNLMQIIEAFYQTSPIFGVCLGLQGLVEFFGGSLKFIAPMHGKSDEITHDGKGVFTDIEDSCEIARYHSLAADKIPNNLEVSARSADGTVMGIRHKFLPIEAVQFHPESVLSMKNQVGERIIANVVNGKLSTGNRGYLSLMKSLQDETELSDEVLEQFMINIVNNQLSEDQKLVLLVSLSFRLKDAKNLARFIEGLYKHATLKQGSKYGKLAIDVCGTGGSGLPRINTSTLTGLLLSALDVPIVKHGNKAASGRFGSFDLLEAMGLPINFDVATAEKTLEKTNLAFIYAPSVHPVVGQFASSRQRMGIPTIFNVLGPLLNPYNPSKQFIGTAFENYMDLIADAGKLMGKEHVIVVRAEDGLDEISVSVPTKVVEYKNGESKTYFIEPIDFGIEPIPFEKVSSEKSEMNLLIANEIIEGKLNSSHYTLVAINAAFIYSKFKKEISLPEAYKLMVDSLKSGLLAKHLEKYRQIVSPSKIEKTA